MPIRMALVMGTLLLMGFLGAAEFVDQSPPIPDEFPSISSAIRWGRDHWVLVLMSSVAGAAIGGFFIAETVIGTDFLTHLIWHAFPGPITIMGIMRNQAHQ